jgi:acetolactate synthase-1/3 small subunit
MSLLKTNQSKFYEKFLEYELYKDFSFNLSKRFNNTKNKRNFFLKNQNCCHPKNIKNYRILGIIKNELGSTSRLISLLLRKGVRILNLTFGKSEQNGYSRLTLIVQEYPKYLNRFLFNLKNLIQITEMINVTELPSIQRDTLLIKLKNSIENQKIFLNIANFYGFRIADVGEKSLTIQITDMPERIDIIEFQFCKNFEILQSVRSGTISLLPELVDRPNKYETKNLKLNEFQYSKMKTYYI